MQAKPAFSTPMRFSAGTGSRRRTVRRYPTPTSHLLQLAADTEPGSALLHQQQADAGETLAAGTHRHRVVVRAHAAGDEGLAAADAIVIAIAHRTGLQVGHVGAARGLGDRQGHDLLAAQHRRHYPLAHLGTGPLDHRRQADIQRSQPGDQAAGTAAHELFAGRHLGEQIAFATAAVGFRVADAEDPGRAGLEIEFAGKFLGLLPFIDVRQHLALDETAHRIPDQLMGLVEVLLEVSHGRAPDGSLRTYLALAWFSIRETGHRRGRIGRPSYGYGRHRAQEIGRRPARAWAKVPPSTSSSSPPSGTPWAIRDKVRPRPASSWAI